MHIFERTHVAAITLMSYVSRILSKIIIAAQIAFVTHLYENQMARRSNNYAFLFLCYVLVDNWYIEFTQVNIEITFRPKNAKAWLPSLSLN